MEVCIDDGPFWTLDNAIFGKHLYCTLYSCYQVLVLDKNGMAHQFKNLVPEDKDLIMFAITDVSLANAGQQVKMVIVLKRKIQKELLTTFLPTLLLLFMTYATSYFSSFYFEAKVTVNLTIMLVMTTIFTSKIEELPPTSDTKMIDLWLIYCLLVPFSWTLVQTGIEYHRNNYVTEDGGAYYS